MKVNIEIEEPKDGNLKDAVFSLAITEMPVLNAKELSTLPQKVEQVYIDFFKLKNKVDVPAPLMNFIHNTLQGNE